MAEDLTTDQNAPYSRRTLPQTLDKISKEFPNQRYASIPISGDVTEGFRDISFSDIANGVNNFAHQLEKLYGRSEQFETLTYIGIPDLRYVMIVLGAIKCGYKSLLPSPRNPPASNLSLMETTRSTKIFYSPELSHLFNGMKSANPTLVGVQVQSLAELTAPGPIFHYSEKYSEVINNPIVVLHSSGSTGVPKPVIMTHGTFAVLDNEQNLPEVPGREKQDITMWSGKTSESSKFFHVFPPFHLAGFVTSIVVPIFTGATPVLGPPTTPPSGQLISNVMRQHKLRGLFVPPSLAEALTLEPGGLEQIKKLNFVCYAGGPLSKTIGDKLNEVTRLCQFFGSTEIISVQQLFPTKEDWAYMEWNPAAKIRMEPAEDDAYELIVLTEQKGESALDFAFPGITEYHTRDLFRQHPTKLGLWKFHGRRDDIIVLSNGEKFNPIPIESTLHGHPLVMGALVIGQDHSQAALLIEPKPESDTKSLIDALWPTIEEANRLVPGQGRISRDKIKISTPEKPFVRAAKGTIIRKVTGKLYEDEIKGIYANSETPASRSGIISLRASFHLDDVHTFVRSVVKPAFPNYDLQDQDDIYALGLDSIRTIEITKALLAGMQLYRNQSELSWFNSRVLYSNPSIDAISAVLTEGLSLGHLPLPSDPSAGMSALFTKYTHNLPLAATQVVSRTGTGQRSGIKIGLVGASGYLGTQLLQKFLDDPNVSRVYCLSRSKPATTADSKIEFLTADYSKPKLGFSDSDFEYIRKSCDIFFLNAWKVNFNQSLQSFEDNIQSVRTMVDLIAHSPRRARLIFVSSISAVQRHISTDQPEVPELPLGAEYGNVAVNMGYGQSKLVAERVLYEAAQRGSLPITVLRVGQVAGSIDADSKTIWPVTDWLPLVISTSKYLGVLPDLGSIDWIPVDSLVSVISELINNDISHDDYSTYNLVNPHAISWSELLPAVKEYCGSETPVISMSAWLGKLKEVDLSTVEISSVPMIKIIDSFTAFLEASQLPRPKFIIEGSLEKSPSMRELKPITSALLSLWIKKWNF